jgi:dethiobiotin synthetase
VSKKKIIFITGTDTGVGKTLLAAHSLFHLRQSGINALAMKPFCSGGRADVRLLQSLQRGELSDAEMNPFYFEKPLAPLVAASAKNRISLADVVARIRTVAQKCERLVIEGSGGLLVPLGPGFTVADLIHALDCRVIVAARNRLGTINHTLLTIKALQSLGVANAELSVVLMSARKPDLSTRTNLKILSQLLRPIRIMGLPFLGANASSAARIKANCAKVRPIMMKLDA